jgi:hypothetical protein
MTVKGRNISQYALQTKALLTVFTLLSLGLIKQHAMRTYRGADVEIHAIV